MTHFTQDQNKLSEIYIVEEGVKNDRLSDVVAFESVLSSFQKTVVIKKDDVVIVLCKRVQDAETLKDLIAKYDSVGIYASKSLEAKDLSWLTHVDFKKFLTCTLYTPVTLEALDTLNAISFFKHVCVSPANMMTPFLFAQAIETEAHKHGVEVQVIKGEELADQHFGGVLSVGQGSNNPPAVIVMKRHVPGAKKVLLVGKGITFDSGGLSLKRSDRMHEMKFDMTGGAEVAALALLAGSQKLPLDLTVVIPAAENLPDGNATKPGDVITLQNGKTVEVLNTDAEGRVVLADALSHGVQIAEPDLIIDIATLTSSAANALGTNITAYFSNSDEYATKLETAAKNVKETVWRLPLHETYKSDLKSSVADMQNIGRQKSDAIFAALFLQTFVGDRPWIHLDIAGTAWKDGQPTAHSFLTVWELLKTI